VEDIKITKFPNVKVIRYKSFAKPRDEDDNLVFQRDHNQIMSLQPPVNPASASSHFALLEDEPYEYPVGVDICTLENKNLKLP
jgi:hypothetical protein